MMGGLFSRPNFEVIVKTGDVKGAGTNATVYCALIDSNGNRTKDIKLDVIWRDDFEKGNIDTFSVKNEPNLGDIVKVELWRDEKGIADDWFVEYVKIRKLTKEGRDDGEIAPFPFNRWVAPNQRNILLKYDSVLPQFDERSDQRKKELADKKKSYAFGDRSEVAPRRIASLPSDEKFSNEYQWDIAAKKIKLLAHQKLQQLFTNSKWDSLADLSSVYKGPFKIPYGQYNWKSDANFGQQRLRGCSPANVKLCKEIPENFAITDEMIAPMLDDMTIQEAIEKKQLYIVDLEILHGIACKGENKICCPIALFREKDKELLPLAIQLTQLSGDENPVFLPTDPEYTWMLAKMFYNNAECSLHQACTHLGFTHLVCESVAVCVHQTLSPSHPVFRLIAPHFLYLLAINSLAVERLLSEDGWIDTTMTIGVKGLYEILGRKWKQWRFDVNGWLPNELKSRGVDDYQSLSGYLYRNDAMLLHDAICNYVTDVLTYVYDSPEKLQNDYEVQEFAALLVDEENGAGIKGVFGNGKFESLDDLIKVITGTIFIGSVGHAAANFCQYDEYAFPANFPAYMNGTWPTDKRERTEQDILNIIPNRDMTLSIMVLTTILSDRGTNGLGDFEVQYQYEPHAVAAVEKFRKELDAISQKINERNKNLKEPYPYLNPKEVPNAISI